jgi:hypothetical protein
MKKMIKFLALAVVMLTFTANIFAQSTTANASATIITPLSIAFVADMNFGSASVTAVPGTIQMSAAAAPVRTPSGGVALSAIAPAAAAATFTVTGAPTATYTISVAPAILTISNGGNNMTVDTWTFNPTSPATIPGGGSQTLYVGATLHVGGSQATGLYTSAAPFTVTVGYN